MPEKRIEMNSTRQLLDVKLKKLKWLRIVVIILWFIVGPNHRESGSKLKVRLFLGGKQQLKYNFFKSTGLKWKKKHMVGDSCIK